MRIRMCKVTAMVCSAALLMQFSAVVMTGGTHLILENPTRRSTICQVKITAAFFLRSG